MDFMPWRDSNAWTIFSLPQYREEVVSFVLFFPPKGSCFFLLILLNGAPDLLFFWLNSRMKYLRAYYLCALYCFDCDRILFMFPKPSSLVGNRFIMMNLYIGNAIISLQCATSKTFHTPVLMTCVFGCWNVISWCSALKSTFEMVHILMVFYAILFSYTL